MEKTILSKSANMSTEYCISIVKIGEVTPIENSDFLGKVIVNGRDIVVRKDTVHEGDYLFYASNECQLNSDFLSANNEFEIGEFEMNANADQVRDLINQDKKDEAKALVGYFDKHARVRMKRLRGVLSMGYLFPLSSMVKWCPIMKDFNMSEHEGEDFDTVNGELFVKAYVPPVKENLHTGMGKGAKLERKVNRFDRMIPGQFSLHYDTQSLNKCMTDIKPDDVLSISVKLHGSSLVIGNVLTKKPITVHKHVYLLRCKPINRKLHLLLKEYKQKKINKNEYITKRNNLLELKPKNYTIGYDVIYSSRKIIKNKYINKNVSAGFYGSDIWGEYYDILKTYIPKGYTLYGEIMGYVGGSNSPIQKVDGMIYDYKCNPGENKVMFYRISEALPDGTKKEWNIKDVYEWTIKLKEKMSKNGHSDWSDKIHPIDILYHGKLKDLYSEIDTTNHWHENILEALKHDVEHFGMEQNEPLCRNKCYREGIVIRKDNDALNEAWKLKCEHFLYREANDMDKGIVSDGEMIERY